MTTSSVSLSNIELNNQLIMGKKYTAKSQKDSGNGLDSSAFVGPEKHFNGNDMTQNLGMTADMESEFGSGDSRTVSEEPKLSKEDPQETRHLKELLLLHLDWIQQQQEALLAKDSLISRLQQEKEALKCRLERMDRRMQLLRQKNDSSPSRSCDSKRDGSPHTPATSSAKSQNQSKGTKRKHSLEPQNLNKKFEELDNINISGSPMVNKSTCTDSTSQSTPKSSGKLRQSRAHRLKLSPLKHQAHLFSQQPPRKCRSQHLIDSELLQETPTKATSEQKKHEESDCDSDEEVQFKDHGSVPKRSKSLEESEESDSEIKTTPQKLSILRTEQMYYVPCEVQLPPWEISPRKPTKIDEVLVPTFRIKQVPTGYQLEGTENLTDEVYIKRHQKPETDEKRRKRWDAQMIREQKMLERLQQRGNNSAIAEASKTGGQSSKRTEDDDLYSFLPDPDNAKFVEICDRVPVGAFGYPIPDMSPLEFTLPWFSIDKHAKDDRGKRGRRASKI